MSIVNGIDHMAFYSKLQNDRSVSTLRRQRTDLGTLTGKLCVHAGADVKDETFYYLLGRFRKPQRHAEKTTHLCASLRTLR